jgi:hypothetical protein
MRKILFATAAALLLAPAAFASTPSFGLSSGNTLTLGSGSESITSGEAGAPNQTTFAFSANVGAGSTSISANKIDTAGATTSTSFNLGGGIASPSANINENGDSFGQASFTGNLDTDFNTQLNTGFDHF